MTSEELETTIAERKDRVQQDKDFTSARISDLSRYIGFGLAGVVFLLLTSSSDYAEAMVRNFQAPLVLSATLGCLTVLFDYLHYFFGYLSSRTTAKDTERNYQFNPQSKLYVWRFRFFWAKQVCAVLGAVILIVCVLVNIA